METQALFVTIVGIALAVLRAVQVGRLAVAADAFAAVMEKLAMAGNLERARKLCSSVQETPLGAGAGALVANRELPRGTTELVATDTLRASFVDAFSAKANPLVSGRFLAFLSFFALVGPSAWMAATSAASMKVVLPAAVGLAVLAWSAYTSRQILASGPVVLERLLPKIVPLLLRGPATPIAAPPIPPSLGGLVLDVRKNGVSEGMQTFEQSIVKIGRDSRAHVCLDDPTVGRMHAVVERSDSEVTVIDLGNAPGTLVNGQKVSKAKLSHGDVITIGPYELVVGIGTPTRADAPPVVAIANDPDTDDPRTWASRAAVLYGFDERSPDLFYEIATSIGRGSGLRFAKLRREGPPRFVIAMLGDADALARVRTRIEKEAPLQFDRFATPASEIPPDAVYGPETRTYAKLREEMARAEVTVLVTTRA